MRALIRLCACNVLQTKEVETVTELLEKMDREYRELQGRVLDQYPDAPRTP